MLAAMLKASTPLERDSPKPRERVFSLVKAGIAQLVEQLICNQQVVGSNPTAGSNTNVVSSMR
jgi:hypothetical protein